MDVYLIRHGETYGNIEHFHQGWGNVGLTEKGISQAKALGAAIADAGLSFDRHICSDLYRAKQTASIIFEGRPDIVFEYDARLREINNSVLEGQKSSDLRAKYGQEYREDCNRLDYSKYGGESVQSMLERTASFLEDIKKDRSSEKIAVITHGGVIHAIISNIFQMQLYIPKMRIDNCSVTKLTINFEGEHAFKWKVNYINLTVDPNRKGFSF